MGMYNAIIYSRTMLENIIDKFNPIEVYDIDNKAVDAKELAIKSLSENIETEETENMSFEIMVNAPDTMLSANINNYIIIF